MTVHVTQEAEPTPNPAAEEASPAAEETRPARSPFAVIRGLAGLTLLSRALGFVRDVLMAMALGTGLIADAFFLAWALPNLARRLFGEGAFSAALVPVFIDAREQGDDTGARKLVSATICRLAIALVGVVLVLEVGCYALGSQSGLDYLRSVGVGERGLEKVAVAMNLAQTLLPYLVFICLAGVLGGALNALDRFTVPAAAPIVLNLVWIAALVAIPSVIEGDIERVKALTLALVAGGVLQLLMHTRAMKKAGFGVQPRLHADPDRIRRVRSLFLSLGLGLALFQLNVLLDSVIAYTLVEEGGVSILYFANRLVQLPIGVLGVALSTAIFPELARRVKRGDMRGLGEILDRGLSLGAYVSVPAAVGLVVLSTPVVTTLFEHGRFDADSTARTSFVLFLLAPAVVTACVTPVITRAFYAEEQVKTPVRVGIACVLLNLTLNLLLVGPLQEAGLALATSISQGTNLIAQAWLYRRRRRARGDTLHTAQTMASVATFVGLAMVMGGVAFGAHRMTPGHDAVRLAVGVISGVVVYAGLSHVLKLKEFRLLLQRR